MSGPPDDRRPDAEPRPDAERRPEAALDFTQLRSFVAVAEELHFARAAARLNITQPPLSRQIQVLERTVGATLLERTSRSVRLTAAGRSFLPEARRILRLAETATRTARQIAAGRLGTVRLSFTAASAYDVLPRLLVAWRQRCPGLHVDLAERVTRDSTEALVAGRSDFALLRPPVRAPGLDALAVASEPLVLALPEDHALAGTDGPVPVGRLAGEPLVSYDPDEAGYFHDLVAALLDRHGVAHGPVHEMGQIHSILALVRSGFGVALVPESATRLHPEGVVFRPLAADTEARVRLSLAWREDSDHPARADLLAAAREIAGNDGA